MHKVKLAVVLPLVFCATEAMLWYWELHSQAWVPSFNARVSPAILISTGLDFPAWLVSISMEFLIGGIEDLSAAVGLPRLAGLLSRLLDRPPTRLIFLLCVACCWYFVGRWLDRRASQEDELKSRGAETWRLTPQLLILALGVLILFYSYHVHIWSFIHTIERALVQSWAVFLIGVPASRLARRLLKLGGREQPTVQGRRAHWPFSNFRLFLIAIGVFAALLILGVLTSPAGPPWIATSTRIVSPT